MVTWTVSGERCSKQRFNSSRKIGRQRRCQISLCLLREKRAVKQGNECQGCALEVWNMERNRFIILSGMWEVQPSQQHVSAALQQERISTFCRVSKRGRKVPWWHSPNLGVSLSCSEHLQARWGCSAVSGRLQKQQQPLPRNCALQQD